jgi:hypothetical protein
VYTSLLGRVQFDQEGGFSTLGMAVLLKVVIRRRMWKLVVTEGLMLITLTEMTIESFNCDHE